MEGKKFLPWRYFQDVFKTYLENNFKTSWRPRKCLLGLILLAAVEMNSLTNFLKVFWKFRKTSRKRSSTLLVFIIQENPWETSPVKFLFIEADATCPLQNKSFLETPRKACKSTWKGHHHGCFTEKFPKVSAAATLWKD